MLRCTMLKIDISIYLEILQEKKPRLKAQPGCGLNVVFYPALTRRHTLE